MTDIHRHDVEIGAPLAPAAARDVRLGLRIVRRDAMTAYIGSGSSWIWRLRAGMALFVFGVWGRSHRIAGLSAAVLAVTWYLVCAGYGYADTPISAYSAVPSTMQAGGHPDVEIHFEVANRKVQVSHSACNCEDAKNADVELPPGFIGNPHATPQCTIAEFSSDTCPIDSQVGIVNVEASGGIPFNAALYNLVPPPEDPGLLAFKIFLFDTPQFTVLHARTATDYGLDADATSIYHGFYPLKTFTEDLWGVPAESSHDLLRLDRTKVPGEAPSYIGSLCDANGSESTEDPTTIVKPCGTNFIGITPVHSNSPLTPFLQNPTNCSGPLTSSLEVLSYDGGVTHAEDKWPQQTGCDQLGFNPSLYAQPSTTETDSPSGIDINLTVPQELSPTIPSPTELRGATVTLPPGFSINPNAADGKTACGETEAQFSSEEEAQCPEDSKVGSLSIESSALPGPVPGFVYLGQPLPGNRYRIFLVANGFGTHIKLAGSVAANPQNGQLVITFKELPQTPLTAFNMHFFGSERGLLATPTQCGTYPVESTFEPWDETIGTQTSRQFFSLEAGPDQPGIRPGTVSCPGANRPFDPNFEAASSGNTAGAHTTFAFELSRKDGDQNLAAVDVTTPPGLSATLAGVPYCSDASLQAASSSDYTGLDEEENPSCPSASQIGVASTGVGAGTHPLYVSGKVYLAGPYKGAPLSLAVITPAVSGPYDLGNVVVRAALHLNPESAQITAVSDPLPQILEGIPLRLRSILVELNRPNFTLNPTHCGPMSVDAEVFGNQGAIASPSEFFQIANCAGLPFDPKLKLRITGATQHSGNPSLQANLTAQHGEANIATTTVTLPKSELIDNAHIKNPCTRVQFAEGAVPGEKCPPGSEIGSAKVITPLLEGPLHGPVYLRSAPQNKSGLPDIVAALNGQIDIDLDGKIETVGGRLKTSFMTVPDAPVSNFSLTLDGGGKGLLVNSANLCHAPMGTTAQLEGQNGALDNQSQVLSAPCGKTPRRKLHRTHLRRVR